MPIQGYPYRGLHGGVDEAQAMSFAFGQLDLTVLACAGGILVSSIDQYISASRRTSSTLDCLLIELEGSCVDPVSYRIGSKIDIVIGGSRTIDDKWTNNTISVLDSVMAAR
jgi:hypothetical protein